MRTCEKPQFWQLSSTRTPGWYFSACERNELCVLSKILASSTFTSVGAKRRFVTLRVADTTTSPSDTPCGTSSKSATSVASGFVVTLCVCGTKPGTSTSTCKAPIGRFLSMKCPVTSVDTEMRCPFTVTKTRGKNSPVAELRTCPTMCAGRSSGAAVAVEPPIKSINSANKNRVKTFFM